MSTVSDTGTGLNNPRRLGRRVDLELGPDGIRFLGRFTLNVLSKMETIDQGEIQTTSQSKGWELHIQEVDGNRSQKEDTTEETH